MPELDDEDHRLLAGDSGKTPLGALGAFALRCLGRGWGQEVFEVYARDSSVVDSLCHDGKRARPQRRDQKIAAAWLWAEKEFNPGAPVLHSAALDNLRRELVSSNVLTGDELAVTLGLITKAQRDGHNPVIGPCREVADIVGMDKMRVNRAMQRLVAAASPDHPIRGVAGYRLKAGASKGCQTRMWSLNLGWRAQGDTVPCVPRGDIPVSRRVALPTSADTLSYFRGCISNLALGETKTTRELADLAGVPANKARAALNELHRLGEVDRFESRIRTGTMSYRWCRFSSEAEAAEAEAIRSANVQAIKAKHAEDLNRMSPCRWPGCTDTAPPGRRRCDSHHAEFLVHTASRSKG